MRAARGGGGSEPSGGLTDALANAQIEGGAQFWTRAYPRRWRKERGEELLDVVVGLADLAGNTRRLDAPAVFDLVRGGWATRWREHPSLRTWLLYRMFERRIPAAHRSWALDDIDGFWYPMRRYLANLWWFPIFLVAVRPKDSPLWTVSFLVVIAFAAVLSMFLWPESIRSRARFKHVAPEQGERPAPGALVGWEVPGERATARSALNWAALFLGATGVASVVAAVFAPKVLLAIPITGGAEFVVAPMGGRWVVAVAILTSALFLWGLGGYVARRRLNRLLAARPTQPYRVVWPLSAMDRARVIFWALIIGALTWLEVSGLIVLGLSLALGTVALLLLPGVLLARIVTRGEGPDLAGSDVWWIATRGRVPAVDRPVYALRPLPDHVTEGA